MINKLPGEIKKKIFLFQVITALKTLIQDISKSIIATCRSLKCGQLIEADE